MKSKVSRRKEIIKIRTEINEIENGQIIEKNQEVQKVFLERSIEVMNPWISSQDGVVGKCCVYLL